MRIIPWKEYERLCDQPLKVPLYVQVASDLVSPIRVYFALREEGKKNFLLESREHAKDVGRYSFLGFNPKTSLEIKDGKSTLYQTKKKEVLKEDHETSLKNFIRQNKTLQNLDLPPLAGGAVGFMSYDAVRLYEDIPCKHKDEHQLPDIYLGFYETIIVFDHLHQLMTLIYTPDDQSDPKESYRAGIDHLKKILNKILSHSQKVDLSVGGTNENIRKFETDCDDATYQKIVKKCKEYILAGDIFQVVPSRSFYKKYSCDPIDIFRILRIINPSPYMFYLDNNDYIMAGSSPERFASLQDHIVESMPIGGTAPRGKGEEDLQFELQLLEDEKEIAEHMMLVDLARNDFGRIAMPGSVVVKDLRSIQRLSHVMHITSRVVARIKPNYDALDVLKVVLPTGTLSGAPKIRAMEIIDEVEKSRRGIYGGAICYIDNLGNLDSCIAIRMAFLKDGIATVRAGAGVVYDSVPEKEAKETLQKASAVMEAIDLAEGGRLC